MRNGLLILLLLPTIAISWARAQPGSAYLYVSDQRIVTAELADEQNVILNYINLGQTYEVLLPYHLVVVGQDGKVARGHLFRTENPSDPMKLYSARELVKPGKYEGFQIVGQLALTSPVAKVLYFVGGRILELEPVGSKEFEMIAQRVGLIDLNNADRRAAVERAGFFEGHGRMYFAGSEEAAPFQSYFEQSKVLPPVALATPAPRLPTSESSLPDPVIVSVRAVVSKAGGLMNVQVNEGLNPKLDSIAVQTVQNSWMFLPAISDSEVARADLKLRVIFRR